jgi:YfiH family protein
VTTPAFACVTPAWPAPAPVRAAFTLRAGGVSVAPCATLNVGAHVGDAPAAVHENRRRVREALGLPGEPLWLEQVHGTAVCEADAHTAAGPPRADAVIARAPGRVAVIQVADCLPVLLAARDGSAVAAAHAGWRGLAAGVLERTVEALADAGGGLRAWLGPAIGPSAFQVGAEVREALLSGDAAAAAAFAPNARGRWHADLESLARRRLARLGVEVAGSGVCTFTDRERFFSFRREARCGRMATLAWLEGRDAVGTR